MTQLTFENLKHNVSVPRADRRRLGRQAMAIYSILKAGPVWTEQLGIIAKQYNARIKEIRDWLREFGMTVDCTYRGDDGNNRYELRPFHGSNYQRHLMAKQSNVK